MFFTLCKTLYTATKNYILYKYNKDYVNTVKNTLNELSKINIFFTKLIQWISDNHVNDEEISNYIKVFTNNVEYNHADIDYKTLLELNLIAHNNGDKLVITDFTPINSGTISLVFKGLLNDKPVVIKLLRQNIEEKIKEAINLFIFIGNITNYLNKFKIINNNINLHKIISQNINSLLEQTNFIIEIDNLNMFYNSYKNNNSILIPKVYKYFTENNVKLIVMDYIEGRHINDLDINERDAYCDVYLKSYMLNNFKHGIVHGDLHPGNILFLENNMIGYIDFGIVYKINIDQQNFLYKFINNFIDAKYNELIDDLFDIDTIHLYFNINDNINIKDRINIAKNDILQIINKNEMFKDNNLTTTDILNLMKILNDHNIEFNDFTYKLLLTTASGMGFIYKLSNMKFNDKISDAFNKFRSKIRYDIM
jgi:ubiquinone biosynthesis protein